MDPNAILEGCLLGLFLSAIGFGPILLMILESTLERGRIAGYIVSLGVFISDLFLIWVFLYFGKSLVPIVESKYFKPIIGSVGGVALMAMGLYSFFYAKAATVEKADASKLFTYFFKGILVNVLNPFALIFWFFAATVSVAKFDMYNKWVYLMTTNIIVVLNDLVKAYFSGYLQKFIQSERMVTFKKIIGILLMVFAIVLFVRLGIG